MQYQIMLVGEAWGQEEELRRQPFVGPAGWCLNKMLEDAGIARYECYLTNVFNLRPEPSNDISNLCGNRKEVRHILPPLSNGKYILDRYLCELDRLYAELADVRPNLVVCLGGTASWALMGNGSISRIRGSIAPGHGGIKCLATYHPAAVLRDWSLRPVSIADLIKARRQSAFADIRLPAREVWIEPALADLYAFWHEHLSRATRVAVDIETASKQITCVGFATDEGRALVIPFVDERKPNRCYWDTLEDELTAWAFIRGVLQNPAIEKVGQNGLYDLAWLWGRYGLPTQAYAHDTMLLHHSIYPELPKGLGFLGSVYTEEQSWKLLRDKRSDSTKREDE